MNIASNYPYEAKKLQFILGVTFVFLILGFVTPIVTLKKFLVIENTFSVLSGTFELLKEGEIFLFILIAGFSVVLPILKILVLNKLLSNKPGDSENIDKYLHWMHLYGKWSMLDVFVVAVLVVTVKLGAIASVEMRMGLYSFAVAVLLTMYVTARVVSLSDDTSSTH